MKKFTLLILIIAISTVVVYAQAPQAFNYTGIALDSKGKEIRNENISVFAEILDGAADGLNVFTETHYVSTDNKGFFSIQIGGANNSLPEGSLGAIEWGDSPKWLAISVDTDGGSNFQLIGSVQLLSVPYALHAESAGIFLGGDYNNLLNSPENVSDFYNDVGYLTSFTEADPVFGAHSASGIAETNISNWNHAFGWGDHASAGYISENSTVKGLINSDINGSNNLFGRLLIGGNSTEFNSYKLRVKGYSKFDALKVTDLYVKAPNLGATEPYLQAGEFYIGWNKTGGRGETCFFTHEGNGWRGGYDFYADRAASPGLQHIARMEYTGDLDIGGSYGSLSDERKKTNIQLLNDGLEKILKLEGVYFQWKDKPDDYNVHIGLIAQDVLKIVPEVVGYGVTVNGEEDFYSLSYDGLIPVMIEAIKEQQKLIEGLKREIERIK